MAVPFILVGENIHCTRIRLTSGKFVGTLPDGRKGLAFKDAAGASRLLPIPASFVEGEEWNAGKVRHVAVAVQQGMYGRDDEKAAGIAYIQSMAREQEADGAAFLDLNVDEFSRDQEQKLAIISWLAKVVQQAVSLPLSIDSSNADILRAGIAACDRSRGTPLVNSVSLEREASIPVAAAARVKVIAGASGAASMPDSVDARLANMRELMEKLDSHGFARGDIYLDPLVFPISVNPTNGTDMLTSVEAMRAAYGPDIHFAPGLSNISFGLPQRSLINQVFTYLCRQKGCDGGIVDPRQINDRILDGMDPASKSFRLAEDLLLGRDEFGMEFITAAREGTL